MNKKNLNTWYYVVFSLCNLETIYVKFQFAGVDYTDVICVGILENIISNEITIDSLTKSQNLRTVMLMDFVQRMEMILRGQIDPTRCSSSSSSRYELSPSSGLISSEVHVCAVDVKVQYGNRKIAKERKVNRGACVLVVKGGIKETDS